EEVKANTAVDAVVLRKGRKETVKGISLGEPKAKQERQFQFKVVPGHGAAPELPGSPALFNRIPQPHIVIGGSDGKHSVITTMFRTKDSFTTRHQEGSLVITVTGSVTDGKSKLKQIEIQDGGKSETY